MLSTLPILPRPNGTAALPGGALALPGEIPVALDGFSEGCLGAFAQRTGLRLTPGPQPLLCLHREKDYAPEEYSLRVGERDIHIHAGDERGIIWALTSLYLLLGNGKAPQCEILRDKPRYAHRGLMLDCARHFFPVEEVQRVIEQLSLAKINVFHWHLSDDQGWRIESRVFPELHRTENQPYYTQQQIRQVVAFAAERGVEVVPEIDMPGHTTAMLAAYPVLSCRQQPTVLGSSGGIFPVVLCPGKEEVFDFLFPLLDEVAGLFDSPRFHLGGDEVPPQEWTRCGDCRQRMEELGLKEPAQLQRYFMGRVAGHLRKLGKQPVFWNDCLRGGDVDEDVLLQYWVDMQAKSPMVPYLRRGGRAVFSDMFHCYFDYPHGATPLKKVYNYRPAIEGLDASRLPNTLGVECCVWTERIPDAAQLHRMVFPRALAIAEIAWSNMRDYGDFERRLLSRLPQLRHAGVACAPRELWNPKGKQRRDQVLDYLRLMATSSAGQDDAPALNELITLRFLLKMAREFFRPADLLHLLQIKKALTPSKKQ